MFVTKLNQARQLRHPLLKKITGSVLPCALALSLAVMNLAVRPETVQAAGTGNPLAPPGEPTATGSVNLLAPGRFTPQEGLNLKVSSESPDHPGADALRTGGSGYWRNSSSNVYMNDYAPSSLTWTVDLGALKKIDKLYLEIPNSIANIQKNATRFEVYYSNDPSSWASAPTASDTASNYDWKANGWTLAGGTETEGLWSYITYNGQQWGYDTKTFLYPFTARYVMINTTLVGPRDRRTDESASLMGLSDLAIYGKDPIANATALVPDKSTYSTWDQSAPVSTSISLADGQSLTSIANGDAMLVANTDYTLSGNTVTLAQPYLAKLPLGTNEFTFHFNSGEPSVFAVDVTARGYGANAKTIKMSAIEGVSPYNVLGGAMGTDEPVEGVTKRIRDAYHAYYGDQPRATAADDKIRSVWNDALHRNVFQIYEFGRGVNNEFLDQVRDGEYGHKGVFDWNLGYVVGGAAFNDRQRVEIRPSEDSTGDFVAHEGDIVSYQWLWNIPDGNQWNQPNFRHIFQLKAVNAQAADTLPGGNTGGENGAYIVAMSISGTTGRDLVVNHNRYDGDKTLLRIPLSEIDGHWIKVELSALISDSGWLTVKITDTVTGKVYSFDSPDVDQAFTNQGATDGVKDLWRRPERSGGFETEFPAVFDQYERPKWGIYRSSKGSTNSAYDATLQLADITISKVATGISSVNLALHKKAYNVGPTDGANPVQLQSAGANAYGNADKLTTGVLEDPSKWDVTNVTSLDQIGNYSWLGTDGARKGSFVIDLGQALDFSQIRLFAKSTRLKGATVYVSDDVATHTSAAELNAITFRQVDRKTVDGYTFVTGNSNGGTDSSDSSYPISLGKTYHSRYIKVTVENASGDNAGTDLTGPPRLTQVQVFNAPCPPQHLAIAAKGSAKTLKWDANGASEGFIVYDGTTVLADLPADAASYTLPSDLTDLTHIAVRSKGTDPYSRKFMVSAPALAADPQDTTPPVTEAQVAPAPLSGWLDGDAFVTLTAHDDLSAVAGTEYKLEDSADWQTYTGPVAVTNEGVNELQFRSADAAGNIEQPKHQAVQIDKTAPTFALTVNGATYGEGAVYLDNQLLNFNLTASDALSGVATRTLAVDGKPYTNDSPLDVAGKLGAHTVLVAVTDTAGNSAKATIHFTVDTSVTSMLSLIDRYIASGDISGPMVNALKNSLDQVVHDISKGLYKQAAAHMHDFLKLLDTGPNKVHVSVQAREALTTDVMALLAKSLSMQ